MFWFFLSLSIKNCYVCILNTIYIYIYIYRERERERERRHVHMYICIQTITRKIRKHDHEVKKCPCSFFLFILSSHYEVISCSWLANSIYPLVINSCADTKSLKSLTLGHRQLLDRTMKVKPSNNYSESQCVHSGVR